jgi:glycosyltransferase involved in cell wall biosynthesis
MKILHVIICLNVGGAEMMLRRLINSYSGETNYEHIVVSLTDVGVIGQQLKRDGIHVEGLGMRSLFDIVSVLLRLIQIIRRLAPDVVQTWMYHADLLGGLAARLAGHNNVIWGVHSTDVRAGGSCSTMLVMRACALLSRWVPNTILCVAEVSRQVHVSAGYFAPRTVVIPNGIDISKLISNDSKRMEIRRKFGFKNEHVVIGTLGRFNPAKDYENFVAAAGILAKKYPHVRFMMVGNRLDAENAVLIEWIEKTGFQDRFALLGERSDAPDCLASMDIFCLSSRSEALPTVVIEAMGMGLPCVATNVGDTAALIEDVGIVVPKENPAALAAGLERVMEMPANYLCAISRKGKERVRENFTIEQARDRIETLYTKISKK